MVEEVSEYEMAVRRWISSILIAVALSLIFGTLFSNCSDKEQDDRIDALSTQIAQMEAQK